MYIAFCTKELSLCHKLKYSNLYIFISQVIITKDKLKSGKRSKIFFVIACFLGHLAVKKN